MEQSFVFFSQLITLIIISAFLSICEISVLSVDKIKLNILAKKSKMISLILKNQAMIGSTFMTIGFLFDTIFVMYISLKAIKLYPTSDMILLPFIEVELSQYYVYIVLLTSALLYLATLFPKIYASNKGSVVICKFYWFIFPVFIVLYPIMKLIELPLRVFGIKNTEKNISRADLDAVLSLAKTKGIINHDQQGIISNIASAETISIRELYRSTHDIESVYHEGKVGDNIDIINAGKHKYYISVKKKGSAFIPLGVVVYNELVSSYLKDKEILIADIAHKPTIFKESDNVLSLILSLQDGEQHIAIIMNEHDVMVGIVKIYDVIDYLFRKRPINY